MAKPRGRSRNKKKKPGAPAQRKRRPQLTVEELDWKNYPNLRRFVSERGKIRSRRITGLSLHALVYTPDGRRVFQGWGGLDLVHVATTRPAGGGDHEPYLVPQRDLLGDAAHLQEGVAEAFDGVRMARRWGRR